MGEERERERGGGRKAAPSNLSGPLWATSKFPSRGTREGGGGKNLEVGGRKEEVSLLSPTFFFFLPCWESGEGVEDKGKEEKGSGERRRQGFSF